MFSIRVSGKSSLAVHGVRFKGVRTISRGKCGMPPREARFGADLLANCWQAKIFLPTRMGQKFSEKLQETLKKAKKSLHPQTKVQESLVPPAGIEPARV